MSSKKISELALFTAICLIIFIVESLLVPVFPIAPYAKLGLSNAVIVFIICKRDIKDAYIVMLAKTVLGSLITGRWYAFAFNITGGFFALTAMGLLFYFLEKRLSLVSISVVGAVISNIARTAVGAMIMQTAGLFFALPAIAAISFAGGVISGALAILFCNILPEKIIK